MYLHITIADLAAADCDYAVAQQVLAHSMENNIVARIRLAEIQALASCDCGGPGPCRLNTPGLQDLVTNCHCGLGFMKQAPREAVWRRCQNQRGRGDRK